MGPNGAGKSTLGYAIMGNPNYDINKGNIIFKDKDITGEEPHERAKDGIFLSFQNPIEVPGISLSNFIRNAVDTKTGTRARLWDFRKSLEKQMEPGTKLMDRTTPMMIPYQVALDLSGKKPEFDRYPQINVRDANFDNAACKAQFAVYGAVIDCI